MGLIYIVFQSHYYSESMFYTDSSTSALHMAFVALTKDHLICAASAVLVNQHTNTRSGALPGLSFLKYLTVVI